MTGGQPDAVEYLTRKQCIQLCLHGYHGTNENLREKLRANLEKIGMFHFDLIDTDHDG